MNLKMKDIAIMKKLLMMTIWKELLSFKKLSANPDYKHSFKYEYICTETFTLTKHNNTKHPGISHISKDQQMKKPKKHIEI